MPFDFAGSPETAEQFARMLDSQREVKARLAEGSMAPSSMGRRDGVPMKPTGSEPTGAQGEFGQAARDPKAGRYFGDMLARLQNFEANTTGQPMVQQEVA